MATIEEIEARRAKRKEALLAQHAEQLAKDLEELDRLELEHGDGQIVRIDVPPERYTPGLVTMAIYRLPSRDEAKRYSDTLKPRGNKPGDGTVAANQLAAVCRLYPEPEAYKALLEKLPFMHENGALAAIKAAEGLAVEAGKGWSSG